MLTLTLTEKGGEPKELSFDKDEVAIGRVRGNDIVLPKGNVSKHHCRIVMQGGQLAVEDLRSTNGTYVNGRKIAETTLLSPSDKVFVGDFIIRNVASVLGEISQRPPSVPEAGSLSTALPRRPPPPPPPPLPRQSSGMRALDDAPASGPKPSSGAVPPPPPPPPALRDSDGDDLDAHQGGSPAEINLDDEDDDALSAPAPRLNVPPLRPPASTPSIAPFEPPTPPGESLSGAKPREPSAPRPLPAAPTASLSDDYPRWLGRLLGGEGVTAAFFTGAHSAEVERQGRRESTSVAASDLGSLGEQLRKLATKGSPRPSPDALVINTVLPDGVRIHAVFPPVADRLCAVVRRPAQGSKTLDDLLAEGTISAEMQHVIESCVTARQNVLVCGDRAACDTLLRTLAWTVDRVARVIVLAESITPPSSATSWIKLPVEPNNPDLLAVATALQPEHLLVDAAAGPVVAEVLRECALGLEGALVALVARSSGEALLRLQALQGATASVRGLLAASVDAIVQVATLADGSLRVVEIAEPRLDDNGQLRAEPLLTWRPEGKASRGAGHFTVTQSSSRLAGKLDVRGAGVPENVLRR